MSNEQLDQLDYTFHISNGEVFDEDWMHDPEVSRMLADIEAEFPEEVFG